MNTITAIYRIVTPMFCGDAEQEPELRLPSFKGALRFWWRALQWGRVRDVEELRQKEADQFGSSESGQSSITMTISHPTATRFEEAAKWEANEWQNYTGYGLKDAKRKGLISNVEFTVCLLAKSKGAFTSDLLDSLRLLGLVGGLGSRSRNGWGSITLLKLEGSAGWKAPRASAELKLEIQSLITSASSAREDPPFTALTAQSEFAIGPEFQTAEAAQRQLGKFYKTSVQQLLKDSSRWQFGIPRHSRNNPQLSNSDRRAKPLFLHVHQVSGGPAIPVALFTPARFTQKRCEFPKQGKDARALVRAVASIR